MTRGDYECVVYDLDGTLVRLAVDWEAAREDTAEAYREAGVDPDGRSLWDLLGDAAEHGLRDAVEAVLGDHECRGARESDRLPVAGELAALEVPVAVCSLNCEAACRTALRTHGLADRVGAVVGRDTLAVYKPDPRPLLEAVDRVDCSPSRALFVGDSDRDAETARRAGVPFQYAYDS